MPYGNELTQIGLTVLYFGIGLALFGAGLWVMDRLTPFSIRKEIEEDQNVALAILMGSAILGLSIVLSAALR